MRDYPTLPQIAEFVNQQHIVLRNKARNMVAEAIEIGKFLAQAKAQICQNDTFVTWLEGNVRFSQKAAYRYLALYKYQSQITEARNLTEAYKLLETLGTQKKQTATQQAYERIHEYRKTGKKPAGWRRGTDDKLAREKEEQNDRETRERIEALKQEADRLLKQEEMARAGIESFKESIELPDEIKTDPFCDFVLSHIAELEDDNRRIETAHNLIKIGRHISTHLQSRNAQTQTG